MQKIIIIIRVEEVEVPAGVAGVVQTSDQTSAALQNMHLTTSNPVFLEYFLIYS